MMSTPTRTAAKRHHRRPRLRWGAAALITASLVVACSLTLPFDELGNGVRENEGGTVLEDGRARDDDGDSPVLEGGLLLPQPDASLNAAAGFGVFGLRMTKSSVANEPGTVTPIRVEPIDGSVDGGMLRDIGCEKKDDIERNRGIGLNSLAFYYDPTDPLKASFVYAHLPPDSGTFNVQYLLATEQTNCTTKPPRPVFAGNGLVPSFSDDGSRIALVLGGGQEISTGRRVVTFPAQGDFGVHNLRELPDDAGTVVLGVRPAWFRASGQLHLVWAELNELGQVVIVYTNDTIDQNHVYAQFVCPNVPSVRQLSLLSLDQKLYLGLSVAPAGVNQAPKIHLLDFVNLVTTRRCELTAPFFNDVPESHSSDFVTAPDGKLLAHTSDRPETATTGVDRSRIWIGKGDGTRKQCSAPPAGKSDTGPIWIAGGKQIAWTRKNSQGTDYSVGDLYLADVSPDGTCAPPDQHRRLTPGDNTNAFFASKSGSTCAMSRGTPAQPSSFFFAVALYVAWSLRRMASRRIRS